MGALLFASHNQMRGRALAGLVSHYRRLRERRGLDVLCLQENATLCGRTHASEVARALGSTYAALDEGSAETGQAIVYDRRRLRLLDARFLPLPRLPRLSWLQRRYIASGAPEQRIAQVAVLAPVDGGDAITVVNFHLDCAGDLSHRRRQVERILGEIAHARWPRRVVACGDTNAFSWQRQLAALRWLLAPFQRLGARDVDDRPTHWFSRQREQLLTHRLAVAVGHLGLDLPHRYDVVCTTQPVVACGQITTVESDHDLVWAQLAA